MSLALQTIVAGRLRGTPLSADTARAILDGDLAGVVPGTGWPHPGSAEIIGGAVTRPEPAMWLITLVGFVIGEAAVTTDVDPDGAVGISMAIAPTFRRRLLGIEFLQAFSPWLLDQDGIEQLVVDDVDAHDVPVTRCLESARFVVDREDSGRRRYTYGPFAPASSGWP
ncbi:MAG: hypothetical protein JWM34_1930 [Ilumatobacteraceae bacterium]|nr:hypothetical protein [Ilumatobacteraceae bacterium]